jgi:hypothetical protein
LLLILILLIILHLHLHLHLHRFPGSEPAIQLKCGLRGLGLLVTEHTEGIIVTSAQEFLDDEKEPGAGAG